ncbi:unnamed protein product [Nippostrongylus brasiliensis]|uniref:RNA helicase n=1 Tax=Nippostrongylus brasiliensis TaxID=27835 RepID=A0A0N4XZJ0_NIPBR|nr:unnamed protein product [Nippostrongylus brasiliensis]
MRPDVVMALLGIDIQDEQCSSYGLVVTDASDARRASDSAQRRPIFTFVSLTVFSRPAIQVFRVPLRKIGYGLMLRTCRRRTPEDIPHRCHFAVNYPIRESTWDCSKGEMKERCQLYGERSSRAAEAGGLDLKTQEAALRSGPDVVVATPGRLIDHLHNSPSFSLNSIEVLVLDEADRMLEEAFKDQMNELIRLCAPNRQTLLFSATMTDQIDELASMSLRKPVKIFINENTDTALKLRQEFVRIRAGRETDREAIVSALVTRTFQENTIIFVRMKKDCQRMHILLGLLGVKAGQMHSSLSQAQRIEALSKFKRREIDVLVSTDLASRGLDIEGVQTVVNMHMPRTIKQYIHRVGRTARAGRAGRSISLVGEDDRKLLKEIINTNPDRTLKQRVVAPEVVEAYRQRIDSLEDSIQQIDLEEKEERELRLAESAMQKTEEKLETGTTEREGRVWFQKATVSEREKKRAEKKAQRKEELKRKQSEKTPEEIKAEHEMAYMAREAKRARRGKTQRLRAVVEAPLKRKLPISKKKSMRLSDIPAVETSSASSSKHVKKALVKGKKATFTSALTKVGKRAVKKARHGPEDSGFQKARVAHRLKTKKK